MTKVNEFETKISTVSLYALLACAIITFLIFAIFSIDFYQVAYARRFGSWGIVVAVCVGAVHELVRCALLLTSVRDFMRGKIVIGSLGLVASILLVVYDIHFAFRIADLWTASDFAFHATDYYGSFIYDVCIGLVLELRLILTVFKKEPELSRSNGYLHKEVFLGN